MLRPGLDHMQASRMPHVALRVSDLMSKEQFVGSALFPPPPPSLLPLPLGLYDLLRERPMVLDQRSAVNE
jgi:hypothetical protein